MTAIPAGPTRSRVVAIEPIQVILGCHHGQVARPAGWVTFSEPDFDLEFFYPLKGLSKTPTNLEPLPRQGGRAVRVSTPDGTDVYVEVRHVAEREADEGLRSFQDGMSAQFSDAQFGPIEDGTLAGLPALAMTFSFGDRVRRVVFTKQASPSYAVIYDPRSKVNEMIVETIHVRGSNDSWRGLSR